MMEESMIKLGAGIWLLIVPAVVGFSGCQRETPADRAGSQRSQTNGTVEPAVQQTIEGIKGPMDKAGSTEGTLETAAEREAGTTR
jgi:hypothetical protein